MNTDTRITLLIVVVTVVLAAFGISVIVRPF